MFVSHALMELNCFLQYMHGHRTKNKYKSDSIEVTGVPGLFSGAMLVSGKGI